MKITVNGEKACVFTPYNSDFVAAVKGIGGARWNSADRCWTVPSNAVEAVREHMRRIYGHDDITGCETVRVRLTFHKSLYADREGVTIFNKTLALAYGRDSGAHPGEDVIYLEGGCDSGGSAKNWTSHVQEGSVIELTNVARPIYETEKVPEWVTVELIEETATEKDHKKAALLAEKERIEKRLAEIEKELADM